MLVVAAVEFIQDQDPLLQQQVVVELVVVEMQENRQVIHNTMEPQVQQTLVVVAVEQLHLVHLEVLVELVDLE
jgi:hypothetical protein